MCCVAVILGVGGLLATHDAPGGGQPTRDFVHFYDANGNVTQLMDISSGSAAAKYEYDAFGNELVRTGTFAASNRFRFSTKYTDANTDFAGEGTDGLSYFIDLTASDAPTAIVARYEYDPFGNLVGPDDDADGTVTAEEAGPYATVNSYRFSTKPFDAETGLYSYIFRYYSPRLGRWMSRDPIGEAGGLNVYAFIGNDPISGWDYLGVLLFEGALSPEELQALQSYITSLPDGLTGVSSTEPEAFFPLDCTDCHCPEVLLYATRIPITGPTPPGVLLVLHRIARGAQFAGGALEIGVATATVVSTGGSATPAVWPIILSGFALLSGIDDCCAAARDADTVKARLGGAVGEACGQSVGCAETGRAVGAFAGDCAGPSNLAMLGRCLRVSRVARECGEELCGIAARVREIHGALDPIAQTKRTTVILESADGTRIVAGGSRDLTPAQRALLRPGEVAARLPRRHAQVTALTHASQSNLLPKVLTASRPFCPECVQAIEAAGGVVINPTTAMFPR
ncbi:MAG: hypothetical protein CHACPFDD_03227 [Phycisphaerae bacterium]|nr:hypothetical protein [Phycisphaerae bacterium]